MCRNKLLSHCSLGGLPVPLKQHLCGLAEHFLPGHLWFLHSCRLLTGTRRHRSQNRLQTETSTARSDWSHDHVPAGRERGHGTADSEPKGESFTAVYTRPRAESSGSLMFVTSSGFWGLSVRRVHMLVFSLFMSIFFAVFA